MRRRSHDSFEIPDKFAFLSCTRRFVESYLKLPMIRNLYFTACISLITLIFLCLAWELRLAPVQVGGSWLALKSLPLLAPLFGILNGRRYSYQWSSMLILFYFTEGIVRATSEGGAGQWLAIAETLLSLVFFSASIAYAYLTRPSANQPAISPASQAAGN
jgi:uncharacterized membrane protein